MPVFPLVIDSCAVPACESDAEACGCCARHCLLESCIEHDMLERIFDLQERLQERLGTEYDQAFITEMTLAAMVELGEFVQNTDWKSWKDPIGIQRKKAVDEWADVLHFVVNLGLAIGLDAETAFLAYVSKNKENHARQDRGY